MVEVLIRELNNADVDWLLSTGHYLDLESGNVLIHPEQPLETLYILLEGDLAVSLLPSQPHPSTHSPVRPEIIRLTSGEMVGAMPFLETNQPFTTVRALTKARVLAVPRVQLTQRVESDLSFAAHFYRASAMLLSQQFAQIIQQLEDNAVAFSQLQLREAVTLFGELQDSDLDWLIAAGKIQQIAAETVIAHSSRPVDALHIVLDGALSVSAVTVSALTSAKNRVANAFSKLESSLPEQELGRLSRGDMVGETLFVEDFTPAITVRTVRDAQLLTIPRWRLAAKLLHDTGFAARFYRVLALLLTHKQQAIVQQLECGESGEHRSFDASETGSQFLTRIALAEARFEWMLKRIQMQRNTGRAIQW